MTDSFGDDTSLKTYANYRKVDDYSGLKRDVLNKAYYIKVEDF